MVLNPRQVTDGVRSKSLPYWSVDGTMPAFVSFDPSGGGDFSGSTPVLGDSAAQMLDVAQEAVLFDGTFPFSNLIWSPFAPSIAFSVPETTVQERIEFLNSCAGTGWEVTDGVFGTFCWTGFRDGASWHSREEGRLSGFWPYPV